MSSPSRLVALLAEAKRRSGLGDRKLAERGGLSHGQISNVLSDKPRKHPISDEMFDKLSTAFGVPAAQLKRAHYLDLGLVAAEGSASGATVHSGSASDVLYQYDCSGSEIGGLFIMDATSADGASINLANSQQPKASTSSTINTPGVYYLGINSPCPWSLEVRG